MTEEEMKEAIEALQESVSKLETKNKELIDREKKAKQEAKLATEAKEAAEEEKARATNDTESLHKSEVSKLNKQIEELTSKSANYETQLTKLLIDNAISENLTKHNVTPALQKAAAALLRADAKLDNGEARIGDKALSDYISEWAASDDGKPFIAAPANGGSGALGARSSGTTQLGAAPFTADNFSSREIEWAMLAKSDPAKAKAIAVSCGRHDLADKV